MTDVSTAGLKGRIQRLQRTEAKRLFERLDLPTGTTWAAKRADRERRLLRLDLEERIADLIGRAELRDTIRERYRWFPKQGKGHYVDERKNAFKQWFRETLGPQPCVYAFWKGKRCLYVGRTERGGGRPAAHFDKAWFRQTTRIDALLPHQRRLVQKLECLAIHVHRPLKNKFRSSQQPYRSKCPVCDRTRKARREFDRLFGKARRRRP